MLVDIEVSRQDDRKFSSRFFDFCQNEFGAFFAGFNADVVHVQVEEHELESAFFIFKNTPSANAR